MVLKMPFPFSATTTSTTTTTTTTTNNNREISDGWKKEIDKDGIIIDK